MKPWLKYGLKYGFLTGVALLSILGAFDLKDRLSARFGSGTSGVDTVRADLVESTFYMLGLDSIPIPGEGWLAAGAIDALGDEVLVATRRGQFFLHRLGSADLDELSIPSPTDVEVLDENHDGQGLFGVKDVLISSGPSGIVLYATYQLWNPDESCYVLQLGTYTYTAAQKVAEIPGTGSWRPLWSSRPCIPIRESSNPSESGGRMALLPDGTMLLTVGDLAYRREALHELTNSYGKVWRIDLETGEADLFTLGHRNPQGLYVSGSRVWETEHGPKGGDEVNLLEEGGNYGWPFATYGTGYNGFTWHLSQTQGSHEQFDLPLIAWSPSVGVSSLIQISADRFPVWTGDLLVGALRGESLFRLVVEGERVVSSEQIHLGRRVRDLVETDTGHIVLLTDSRNPNDQGQIVIVDRSHEPSESALVEAYPALELCATCHTFGEGMADGLGPNLWGVLGSPVASRPGFAYSPALLQVDGRWTEPRLRALLTDPGFAPGTSMPVQPGLSDDQVEQILSALRTLQ